MKVNGLSPLAGATVPLVLAGSAPGGFVGLKVIDKPAIIGGQFALVVNIFATFNRPGQDRFLSAAGTPNSPMDIHVIGGTFYQNPFGTDTAPSGALIPIFPSLAFDTFVTIGAKAIGPAYQSPPPLTLTPGWPGFGPSFLGGNNLGWANTPADPNTDPFNPAFYLGNGQVLIGQFATTNGAAIVGMFRILVVSNNVSTQINVSFFGPAPGALPLLAAAGFIGTRRSRRRSAAPGPANAGGIRLPGPAEHWPRRP